ncbi:MAG: glycosyltransferase family 4 protein [Actinobacteria bacterium]|nr:glycosyltransferase family 4 protein [Actinomycetota bacterium]
MSDREPLRILMVSDEWRPYIGGAGRCMELFADELVNRGHTLEVGTAWHNDAPAFEDGRVPVHRIRDLTSRAQWVSESPDRHTPPPFPDPEAVWRLRRLVKRFKPDLIPAYGWLAHSLVVGLAGIDVPVILWGHEYGNTCPRRDLYRFDREVCSGPGLAKCMACSKHQRGVAKGAAAVAGVFGTAPVLRRKTSALHSVSRYVAMVYDRDLRVPGAPSVVIENFHEEGPDLPADEEILAQLPDGPYILFVGALRRVKGVEDLLEAYGRLVDPPPLVMVGIRTPDTPESFPAGVTVLNDVPHPTVMAMWERALFGVFPSRWPEPLATVVHEAMSRGRPAIGTTPGGHEDMIDDGETGLIVPSADPTALAAAMGRLIEDDDGREEMGRKARVRARDYTREAVVPRLEEFYFATVDRHRARA